MVVFLFYSKPEFIEEISQKTKQRTVSGPGESLRDNSFIYKLQLCCQYKCLLPNCGVFHIQDGHGTFSLMCHLARMPDHHHQHAYTTVVVYNGRSQCDLAQIAAVTWLRLPSGRSSRSSRSGTSDSHRWTLIFRLPQSSSNCT